jgi:hypothetical protein
MVRMSPLVTLGDRFEARVLVARLGADGILCQIRGEIDSPYPVGPVVVLVEDEHLPEARALLVLDAAEAALDGDTGSLPDQGVMWAVLAAPVVIGVFLMARMMWFLG